jgi:hypothetical protein
VANSNWSSQSSPTEPYETPENIRTDPATDQIKAFRETPCAALPGSRPLRQNTIFTSRSSSSSASVFQRIVASILEYSASNALASLILSAEFLPGLHPANNLLNLSTTESTQ